MAVNMETWRSIDYEGALKRELKLLEKSTISQKNKRLIVRYMNHRFARGTSIARVQREMKSLRLLCERLVVDGRINEDIITEQILELMELGLPKVRIAKILGISPRTLYERLKRVREAVE